ncbi:MAG: ABC transporter permease [Anaerolineae bacterium]|jgi:ABC-2 type transport system permease protein
MDISRIRNLARKELIQLGRDWVMTAFIVTLPVLQLVLLARSTTATIDNLSVALLDADRSAASRGVYEMLRNREELQMRHFPATLEEARGLLDQGDAILAVVIPEGFSRDLDHAAEQPAIQLVVDGSNDLMAGIALSAARQALAEFAQEEIALLQGRGGQGEAAGVDLRTLVFYNPTFDIKLYTIPAQVGFIVYQVTLAVASIGVARERELGTLEQLIVMPLGRLELVIGKAIPALIVGTLNFLLMVAVAIFGFGVPMRGSLGLLLGLTVVFVIAEIGYGIFISGIAHTQQQAILLVFVLAMVDMAFSGYLVPIKNLPGMLQQVARVVPLRHYLTIVRSVMLKGAGLDALWPHAVAMAAMGMLVMAVAVRNLSRSLD